MSLTTRSLLRLTVVLISFSHLPLKAVAGEEIPACVATDESLDDDAAKQKVQGLNYFAEAGGSAVTTKADEYIKAAKACTIATKSAQMECYESCSETLIKANKAADLTGKTIGPAEANEAGNKAAAALRQQAAGFRGFIAACAPKQAACDKTCADALTKLKELDVLVKGMKAKCGTAYAADAVKKTACESMQTNAQNGMALVYKDETDPKNIKSRAGKKQECGTKLADNKKKAETAASGLDKAVQQALTQALTMAAQALLAPKSDTSTAQSASATGLDCAGKDAGTQQCICQTNPRSCNQQYAQVAQVGVNASADKPPIASGNNSSVPSTGANIADAGTGSAGSPTTGAGGTMTGGSGMGDTKPDSVRPASAPDRRTMNANLYNGTEGDSGGIPSDMSMDSEGNKPKLGSSGRGYVGGTGKKTYDLGLTASGGRSNWEKVSVRYNESTMTFIKDPAASPK